MTLTARQHAKDLYLTGSGIKLIARLLQKPRSTVQAWKRRGQWRRVASPSTCEIASPIIPSFEAGNYYGLTWQHMPDKGGHTMQKLKFAMFKRGELRGYESCRGLVEEALRIEFHRIKSSREFKAHR